jgi:hypothetical protein
MEPKGTLLAERVQTSLHKAERQVSRLRKTTTRLLVTSILSSAATTLVTGITAAAGPIVGEGIPGWRLACTVGAVLAFLATVCVGLNEQLRMGDRVSRGQQGVGRLRALDLALATGTRNEEHLLQEYEQVLREWSDLV